MKVKRHAAVRRRNNDLHLTGRGEACSSQDYNGLKMNFRMRYKQKNFISSVGANSMFSKKTCRLAMRSPVCSGFAQKPPKRVILSEQRVASRTFGFVSGNIANKSKSENCQDNFRDLLRFILSFWHKSNFLCRVGFKYNLFVDPSLRRQAACSPFFA